MIVIVSFQKGASEADRESAIKELEQKGAKIVKDNNKHSSSKSHSHLTRQIQVMIVY